MGLFNSEPKVYRNFDNRVFIGSSVSNAKMITNLGLVKASVTFCSWLLSGCGQMALRKPVFPVFIVVSFSKAGGCWLWLRCLWQP